jgi:hypothetical protein
LFGGLGPKGALDKHSLLDHLSRVNRDARNRQQNLAGMCRERARQTKDDGDEVR